MIHGEKKKEGKEKMSVNEKERAMMDALVEGDADKLRELLRCPLTRAEALVNAFKTLLMQDSSITGRIPSDVKGYCRGVFKPKWNNTPTKSVRVPLKFARDIMAFAHRVDKGKIEPSTILDEEDYTNAFPNRIKNL